VALRLIGASSNPNDPDGAHPALVLGVLVGVIGVPILLVGIIADGVRIGLDDRDGS
jgi:hypothetical protein